MNSVAAVDLPAPERPVKQRMAGFSRLSDKLLYNFAMMPRLTNLVAKRRGLVAERVQMEIR